MNAPIIRYAPMLALAALLTFAPAQAASASSIFGNWLTDDKSGVVKVEKCGSQLCGRLVQVLDPKAPDNDINNPDPAKRSNALVGTKIFWGFEGRGATWEDGHAYDPKAGKSYKSNLTLLANGKLKVTGCILVLCRSKYWTRAR